MWLLLFLLLVLPAHALVVYWDPPNPWPGGTVTIFYNVIEGTLPDQTNPVYIHLGLNGWQQVADYPMLPDTAAGWWRFPYSIPTWAHVIDFCFTDLRGNWDNNGGMGIDWHIGLSCSWDPLSPNPNDVVTITVRDAAPGDGILWFVLSNGQATPPIPPYWPPGTHETPDGEAVVTALAQGASGLFQVRLGPFGSARQVVDAVKFRIVRASGVVEPALYEITANHTPLPTDPVARILAPAPGSTVSGQVLVVVEATGATQVEIWGGPDSLGTWTSPPFEALWQPSPMAFGPLSVVVKAIGPSGRFSFARSGVSVPPQVQHLPAPPGLDDGVTVRGSLVSFALYAPAKSYVALKGSFNREYPNGELMYLSGDTLWWLTRELPPGVYHYQYNLEGIKLIADPWSTDVTWVFPGTSVESGSFPHAKTTFSVGTTPYQWNDQGFVRPRPDELVIYELHVSDFVGHPGGTIGTFSEVLEKLEEGYFDSLGVNAVELMPVNEFEGANSWGYNPSFFRAPESAYGTPDDLKRLVDRFHAHGIAVILDVVFNHMWGSAPLFQLYQPLNDWDYRHHDYEHCPYFHNYPSPWGYKLQHWREVNGRPYRTWKYVTDALRTWVQDYHVDGFRYDAAWGVGWDGYNANGMSFYTWYVRQLDSTLIQIAEEDNAYRVNTTETDACWNFSYFHAMKANLQQITDAGHVWGNMYDLANELSYASQGFVDHFGPVNYVESHDETRIIYEATTYQGMDYATALKKSCLGATVLLTGTGIPMLYAGQEFAQNGTSRDAAGNVIPQPLQWQNLSTPQGALVFQHYRRLIWLRAHTPILRGPSFQVTSKSNATKHLVFWRGDSSTESQVVVAANFDSADHVVPLEFPSSGWWYEFTQDDSLEVWGGFVPSYLLPASTARVFVNHRTWPTRTDPVSRPRTLALSIWPNPFDTRVEIRLSGLEPLEVPTSVEIYDTYGRRILALARPNPSDPPALGWDGRDPRGDPVPSGCYFVRLRAGPHVVVRPLVKLR